MMRNHRSKTAGFTLIELLIVVAVIALLTMIALPNYEKYVIRTKRSVGAAELLKLASRQEQYFIDNKTYADTLPKLGYSNSQINSQGDGVASGGIYELSIVSATTTTFDLMITPISTQQMKDLSNCGHLTINNLGQKGYRAGGTRCWG
mgnify:CR=1 FL=1